MKIESEGFRQVGENIWAVQSRFSLGKDQTSGLTHAGLRDRARAMWQNLTKDPQTSEEKLLDELDFSPADRQQWYKVLACPDDDIPEFRLTTCMTAIYCPVQKGFYLHSPTPFDESVATRLGLVLGIICPNLQHHLFVPEWAARFPAATVYYPPEAFGEDVVEKLEDSCCGNKTLAIEKDRYSILSDGDFHGVLSAKLLQGAPLGMNEVLFYHPLSRSLIASDAFYGGFGSFLDATWFEKIWFHMTRRGATLARPKLPIYRTIRVLTHGSPKTLLDCITSYLHECNGQSSEGIKQIIYAHGDSGNCPFDGQLLAKRRHLLKPLSDTIPKSMMDKIPFDHSALHRTNELPETVSELFAHLWVEGLAEEFVLKAKAAASKACSG